MNDAPPLSIARLDSGPIAYRDAGHGRPIVLVHGFPLDQAMWEGQFEGLSDRARLIAPDLPGFGQSPPRSPSPTMPEFADLLVELLDAIGVAERVVLVGLSMGGYIAFEFWRNHALRLGGLALCDTRAAADTPPAAAARRELADRVRREGAGILAETMLPKLLARATAERQAEAVAALRRRIESGDREGLAGALAAMAVRRDMTAELSRIACPTLVVVGEEDAISPPAEMAALAAAVPGARFATIPHAGHLAPWEQPAAFNALLAEFVDALPR